MVPPCSDRISRVPPYSRTINLSTRTGLSPTQVKLPSLFRFLIYSHWPGPRSLATTNGVSVDVLSSGYLDVSVPRVCPLAGTPYGVGCPIQKSPDQSLFAAPRRLSQRITSFIASSRQGIHQMPLRHLITLISYNHKRHIQRKCHLQNQQKQSLISTWLVHRLLNVQSKTYGLTYVLRHA